MIITLSATEAQLEAIGAARVEDLVNRLIEADRAGRHLVVLDRTIADWILAHTTLSVNVRSHLVAIRQSFATRGTMPSVAASYLMISPDFTEIQCDDGKKFTIGVEEFLRGRFPDFPAALVLEDVVSDGQLYEHALHEARKLTQVPSYCYEPVHSGGSRVPQVFELEIAKNRVTTCLVDSDRLSPPDGKSSSALGVLRSCRERNSAARTRPSYVGQALVLPGKELENIVPFSIARAMPTADLGTVAYLSPLINQEREIADEDCLWLFFDIKYGIDGSKIVDKLQRGLISAQSVEWLCQRLDIELAGLTQLVVAGWGDTFAARFLESNEALANFHKFVRGSYWRTVFQPVFSRLLWFFCAPRADRL